MIIANDWTDGGRAGLMRTRYYPAIIETDTRGGFGISFPDFPGCVTVGDSIEQAMANAEEALAGHIEVTADYGDPIPEPSDLKAAPADPEIQEVARVLVRVDLPGAVKPISITLPENLIVRIDRKAEQLGYSRSAFLAEGARRMLGPDALASAPKRRRRVATR